MVSLYNSCECISWICQHCTTEGFTLFYPPHHISYLYLTARFDVTRHIWHQFKGDILQLASRIQQSKQQFCLSISPINPAKLTAGPGRSLCVSFYPSCLSPLSGLLTSLSAFSLRLHQDWQRPIQTRIVPVSPRRRQDEARYTARHLLRNFRAVESKFWKLRGDMVYVHFHQLLREVKFSYILDWISKHERRQNSIYVYIYIIHTKLPPVWPEQIENMTACMILNKNCHNDQSVTWFLVSCIFVQIINNSIRAFLFFICKQQESIARLAPLWRCTCTLILCTLISAC